MCPRIVPVPACVSLPTRGPTGGARVPGIDRRRSTGSDLLLVHPVSVPEDSLILPDDSGSSGGRRVETGGVPIPLGLVCRSRQDPVSSSLLLPPPTRGRTVVGLPTRNRRGFRRTVPSLRNKNCPHDCNYILPLTVSRTLPATALAEASSRARRSRGTQVGGPRRR